MHDTVQKLPNSGEGDVVARSKQQHKSYIHSTKNTVPSAVRSVVIPILQNHLYQIIDLSLQTKQAHWNVKGPNFIALHQLFDGLHAEMDAHADLIAERIATLGGQVYGTVQSIASHSALAEYPLHVRWQGDHLEVLSCALSTCSASLRLAIDQCADAGDQDSADVCTEISRAIDKSLWFIESHQNTENTN